MYILKTEKSILDIENELYGSNITEEQARVIDELCPSKGSFNCNKTCPIYRKYYTLGYSCRGALAKFPDDCISMMREYGGNGSGI